MKTYLFLALVGLMTMISTPVVAGPKLWGGREQVALKFRVNLALSDVVPGTANGAVGAHVLGNLPDEFIITDVIVNPVTAPVGGGSLVVGEDGGGDADGYCLDLDAASLDTAVRCKGALIYTAPTTAAEIGTEAPYKVAATKDGFTYTIASTVYTAGILEFLVLGYQGE